MTDNDVLLKAERQRLLVEWNETASEYPREACIQQLFEAQVERTPDATAVVAGDVHWTYREVNERANQLAHELLKRGVCQETLVGLALERSVETVIGMLAILKAGGVYVPFDLGYPSERIAYMLADTQVRVLLTSEHLQNKIARHDVEAICLDREWERIARESVKNLAVACRAEQLAYVTYTSGSTGQPKGVCVPHRSVVRLVQNTNYVQLSPYEMMLHVASISFDAAVFEIWGALLNGACLVLYPGEKPSLEELGQVLRDQGITTMFLTTGLFQQMVDHRLDDLRGVRQLLAGGEVMPVAQAQKVLQELDGCRLINVYGPTENTTFTTAYPMTDAWQTGPPVPIGRPIANTQVYVLDEYMQPVSVGEVGELYAGGDGVARGYLNRPELTAEKFVQHPFCDDPQAKLYKTGDLVRYRNDGHLEFVGRADDQVKLRGFRIELGEIERVLAQHPDVQHTVVVVREDVPGDKRLVAYVVPERTAGQVDWRDMRDFLQAKLPDYMVPSAVVLLEEMPLNRNGKVDKQALPAPRRDRSVMDDEYVAPRTLLEEKAVEIWADVLGIQYIGVHDHFFEWGGHSLLAMQALTRLRQVVPVQLSLHDLFAAPTVAAFAELVQERVETSEAGEMLSGEPPLTIPIVSREGDVPLSFAQQRLWFLDQMEPGSALYNMPSAVKLQGTLDVEALQKSLAEIVRRHEALRTTFAEVEGQPVQIIQPVQPLSLSVTDLRKRTASERDDVRSRMTQEFAERPFDLEQGPLFRSHLLRLTDSEHLLLLNMHHIVSDGWSMGVLVRELAVHYQAFANGERSPVAELPIQYADYAVWHQAFMQGDVLEQQMAYWKQQLSGQLPVLQVPSDRPKPHVQTFRGAMHRFVIHKRVTEACVALSQQEGATLYMVLLAAFKTLLYRYTGQVDVLVGTPMANRTRDEVEGLIGFFVNTLVLRTDLSGQPTFRELLRRVRDVSLDAYLHQDLPFDQLVAELQPERLRSHSPLFQVMFAYENMSLQAQQLPELSMVPVEVGNGTAKFDLTLFLSEAEDGLHAAFEYNTDLFDAATMVRMQKHWETLLEAILQQADESIATLPLLTAEEQAQLARWNETATATDVARELCLHQLFEQQVERTPDRVAIVFEGDTLTYRELNERANRLAHRLQRAGVQPDALVGLCMERSLELMVGLLGILKAGGAYVPIDPSWPSERVAYLLEDTRTTVVVTMARLAESFLQQGHVEVISLGGEGADLAEESVENVHSGVHADHLAYVIYTSGSTGQPKGVLVPHRGVTNRLLWMQERYQLSTEDRFLQKTPYGFDVSVWEMFNSLLCGARLVIARPGGHQDPAYLVRLIAEQQISIVHFVPSMLGVFLEERGLKTCDSLRMVVCSGEALPYELQERFYARMGADVSLHNFYGPTEASIEVTYWDCERDSAPRLVPIGRPIADTQMYILNEQLQQVPVGVAGELHIGGVGVARGYLNRPELTAEKFISDPFQAQEGARLYKTGDVARYLLDGAIQYLGRVDHQVKIRGFRIELGEIEVVLTQHPAVREAVVTVWEEGAGLKRLVAYVVPEQGATVSTVDVRDFAKASLPEYMVPVAYVTLEALPLSSNGKVDRRALPTPDLSAMEREQAYVEPRTPLEEVLAMIWAEVLGVEEVGACDNFFALGGYSLLGIQVMARIREALQVELSVRHLFDAPTVEGLAAVMLADEGERLRVERTAEWLLRMVRMTDEEVEAMMRNRNGG